MLHGFRREPPTPALSPTIAHFLPRAITAECIFAVAAPPFFLLGRFRTTARPFGCRLLQLVVAAGRRLLRHVSHEAVRVVGHIAHPRALEHVPMCICEDTTAMTQVFGPIAFELAAANECTAAFAVSPVVLPLTDILAAVGLDVSAAPSNTRLKKTCRSAAMQGESDPQRLSASV